MTGARVGVGPRVVWALMKGASASPSTASAASVLAYITMGSGVGVATRRSVATSSITGRGGAD